MKLPAGRRPRPKVLLGGIGNAPGGNLEVVLNQEEGMPKQCVVNLDTLATIRKDLLEARITILSDEKMALVNKALKFALAIP